MGLFRLFLILGVLLPGVVLRGAPALADDVMSRLAGRWYGSIDEDPFHYEWLAETRADGTLRIRFRYCPEGKERVHVGNWYAQEGLIVDQVRAEGTEAPRLTESYAIEELQADYMRYRELQSGTVFEARRVGDGFDLPGCDVVS